MPTLLIRCTKCDQPIASENVDADQAIAYCPNCQTVVEIGELLRKDPNQFSRVKIEYLTELERNRDIMVIRQQPNRTLTVFLIFLAFLLLDVAALGILLYMQSFEPDKSLLDVLRDIDSLRDRPVSVAVLLFVTHVLFLPAPIWSFFDRRTIWIGNQTAEIRGNWLFFFWRKSISRSAITHATTFSLTKRTPYLGSKSSWEEFKLQFRAFFDTFQLILSSTLHCVKLRYNKRKSIAIGCNWKEADALCAEINHFLYTVPSIAEELPENGFAEPIVLGGTRNFSAIVQPYCQVCGAYVPGHRLNFPEQQFDCCTSHLPFEILKCVRLTSPLKNEGGQEQLYEPNRTVELENLLALAQPVHPSLTIEQNKESLQINYKPVATWCNTWGENISLILILSYFWGSLAFVLWVIFKEHPFREENFVFFMFLVFGIILVLPLSFRLCRDRNRKHVRWNLLLHADELRFEVHYKKQSRLVAIPRSTIIEAVETRSDDSSVSFLTHLRGYTTIPHTFSGKESFAGWYLLLKDGTRRSMTELLDVGTAKWEKGAEKPFLSPFHINSWIVETVNQFLAAHPFVYSSTVSVVSTGSSTSTIVGSTGSAGSPDSSSAIGEPT